MTKIQETVEWTEGFLEETYHDLDENWDDEYDENNDLDWVIKTLKTDD